MLPSADLGLDMELGQSADTSEAVSRRNICIYMLQSRVFLIALSNIQYQNRKQLVASCFREIINPKKLLLD